MHKIIIQYGKTADNEDDFVIIKYVKSNKQPGGRYAVFGEMASKILDTIDPITNNFYDVED